MEDLDTFLTVLYVMVDDLCKQHQLLRPQRRGPAPKLGVSEIITLALFGQWARFSSERAFYRFVQRHLKAAFPNLPDHSQFRKSLVPSSHSLPESAGSAPRRPLPPPSEIIRTLIAAV